MPEALQGAASVAGLLITTEAMVGEVPKKQALPCRPVAAAWAAWTSNRLRTTSPGPSWKADTISRWIEEERHVQVFVRDNNVDQALKVLKKKMQREGIFREMKLRGHYEKPSEKKTREKAEAIRRARKLARKKMQREGLLPMKPRVVPGAQGRGGPVRGPRH